MVKYLVRILAVQLDPNAWLLTRVETGHKLDAV
eukprot:CAMPEP_0119483066 /NCGR_PEP_ID=MMETSP1344-20130328/10640_1 /TAXON_ID=236787 /ORGANISM="Florenciella parvula, Strain CCMP2471" /LENGTH=32 /DNA_ID= /DNA_START= /DNA_END= /DNA_ORIENTATION=